ncbi:MAG: MltA domain-containing protein [Rhodospirillales bacterium]|nr:MltA domain-containing protein [Rhodospirillales bacterium]
MRSPFVALGMIGLLAGCAVQPAPVLPPPAAAVPQSAGVAFTRVDFSRIPGWQTDNVAAALPPFIGDCDTLAGHPNTELGGAGLAAALGGLAAPWRLACGEARVVPPGDQNAARAFFERNFDAYLVSQGGSVTGLFTGYFEPEFEGSLRREGPYQTPILRRPPGVRPGQVLPDRAAIEHGALAAQHLQLLWLKSPIDAFFLSVEGAGRIRLPDGSVVRVTYDGQNGRPYVPIGRVLVDRGAMTMREVTMQSIRRWLENHPAQAQGVMDQDPSYVFFRIERGSTDIGPPGALGTPLSPDRSLAVDKAFLPLSAPVFVETTDPVTRQPIERLMVAQDLGGAIKGAVRGDIFFGWGKAAEERAGKMREQGQAYVLLPKGPAMAAAR